MHWNWARPTANVCFLLALITAAAAAQQPLPDAPNAIVAQQTAESDATAREKARIAKLAVINGRPYDQPSHKDQFYDYLRDSYGWPAFARSGVRSLYAQGRGKPAGWGQDWPGFGQRFGSAVAVTAINGNVRYAMETVFREDMRYIPCHGCGAKKKIENALLAEITARHDENGHRFFTLTPTISDFSGPIIANASWYPDRNPFNGVVAARTVFATRIGGHLFTEFILERRHKDAKLPD